MEAIINLCRIGKVFSIVAIFSIHSDFLVPKYTKKRQKNSYVSQLSNEVFAHYYYTHLLILESEMVMVN